MAKKTTTERAVKIWRKDKVFNVNARQQHSRVRVLVQFERRLKIGSSKKRGYVLTERDTQIADLIMLAIKESDSRYRLSTMHVRKGRA